MCSIGHFWGDLSGVSWEASRSSLVVDAPVGSSLVPCGLGVKFTAYLQGTKLIEDGAGARRDSRLQVLVVLPRDIPTNSRTQPGGTYTVDSDVHHTQREGAIGGQRLR